MRCLLKSYRQPVGLGEASGKTITHADGLSTRKHCNMMHVTLWLQFCAGLNIIQVALCYQLFIAYTMQATNSYGTSTQMQGNYQIG